MTHDWPDRLRASETARYLRVSRSTLSKWRTGGKGPPYHRCGPRLIIYLRSELDEWLEADEEGRGASHLSDNESDR
jgi:predicted DNA-binding transcriptional regulator AlpA